MPPHIQYHNAQFSLQLLQVSLQSKLTLRSYFYDDWRQFCSKLEVKFFYLIYSYGNVQQTMNTYLNINKFIYIFELFFMHKDNIEKLQKKVKKLLELSSDEELSSELQSQSIRQHSDPQTVKKCIQLINENKELKKQIQKQRGRSERLGQQLKKCRENQAQTERELQQHLKAIRGKERKHTQEQFTARNTKRELQISTLKDKLFDMEKLLETEKRKCKKLVVFIKKQLPALQETMAVLTGKLDVKLENYFLRDINF